MAKKKSYEFQSRERDYSRNSEGLKQRRLKNDSRWRFNPNESYDSEDPLEDDDLFEDEDNYENLR